MDIAKIKALGGVEFLAKQFVEGFITGLHKSPFHGFSVEFAEHRAYNPGESTRHIDWKVMAKTDRLYVKRYDEETNLRCHILLDTSSSMFFPEKSHEKLGFATLASACIANMLQSQRDAVALTTFSNTIELETPVKSSGAHLYGIYSHLDTCLDLPKRQRNTALVPVLHEIAGKIHKRSLVVIFTDVLDQFSNTETLWSALQHLKHNNHEVLLFHVHHQSKEIAFAYANHPYEFTDLESGQKIKVQPAEIREQYQQGIENFWNELKLKCLQYRIDLVSANVEEGFDPIMQAFLAKRKSIR
jgi:uncharacterized protein (DUF58 family)